jgi:tail lysozyme
VRAAPSHAKERKFRRIGRHSSPSPARKVTRRAAKIVPVVAAIGALGALPQVQHLLPGAPRPGGAQASLLMDSAGSAQAGGAAAADRGAYWSQRARGTAAATAGRHLHATASPRPSPTHPAKPAHSHPTPPGHPARDSSPHTVDCTGGGGPLPLNYAAIVEFLTSHGYTGNAAAGIAGNIYQESGGNPESVGSGGGGLIGWTPLPGGFVTGDVAADLHTQLEAILTFNQQWAQYLPALNGAGSPAEAADIYVTDFERAGIPAAANREAAASAVAAACGL